MLNTGGEIILKSPGVVPYMAVKVSFLESGVVVKDQLMVIASGLSGHCTDHIRNTRTVMIYS